MKVRFEFAGKMYVAESKRRAWLFLNYWDSKSPNIFRLRINWKIKGVERAPDWVPVPVDLGNQIEYK